ncbi:MAG TPA: pentapeptide repeat-containing protein [Pyrinomonadaceae bacterium]|nr:pentapeptide repeat-containing protein [Pyrinomonadaceae bacterium]
MLHYPAADKTADFQQAVQIKLDGGDADFRGVCFPDEWDLRRHVFTAKADFTEAVFNGVTVLSRNVFGEGVDFTYAVFKKDVYFSLSQFVEDAVFDNTIFHALAYFRSAAFEKAAWFESATFGGEADFTVVTFRGPVNFGYTTTASYVKFSANDPAAGGFVGDASLDFQYANVEKPERISFNTLSLLPHWFVNVDPRKFDFANVVWLDRTVDEELESLKSKGVSQPHRRLAIAYRQLAINAEDNHRYGEASELRYEAMDTRQKEKGRGAFWTLDWWYWLASGYGESIIRASVVLLALWLLFAALYTQVGFARWETRLSSEADAADASKTKRDETGAPLDIEQAVAYSYNTITLQKPEPRPATRWAKFLTAVETILGPLQAGLLALAIRRKFMR